MSIPLSKNRISELRALKQKKHRREAGRIVLEGLRLMLQLAHYQILPQELYLAPHHQIPKDLGGIPVFEASEQTLAKICDTQHPQDIAGLYSIPKPDFRGFRRAFYLDGISDPGNMGTIFRIAQSFGIDAIFISEDSADPGSPKVIRASLGAVYTVPFAQMNPIALRLPGMLVIGSSADGNLSLKDFRPHKSQPLIIVIGSEARGISEPIALRCNEMLKIGMKDSMESLNAAVAAGIIAHHIYVCES